MKSQNSLAISLISAFCLFSFLCGMVFYEQKFSPPERTPPKPITVGKGETTSGYVQVYHFCDQVFFIFREPGGVAVTRYDIYDPELKIMRPVTVEEWKENTPG